MFTWPIFTCYDEHWRELRREFLDFAYEFYSQVCGELQQYGTPEIQPPVLPLSSIGVCERGQFVQAVVINTYGFEYNSGTKGFYMGESSEEGERVSSKVPFGIESRSRLKAIFIDFFGFIPACLV